MHALITRAAKAGIDKFVIHPSIEPIDDSIREAKLNAAASFLSELADFAAGCLPVMTLSKMHVAFLQAKSLLPWGLRLKIWDFGRDT